MKVLHAAAEVFPLVKTGGLADVLSALPQALVKAGVDARLVLPGFPAIKKGVLKQKLVCDIGAAFGAAPAFFLPGAIIMIIWRPSNLGMLSITIKSPNSSRIRTNSAIPIS